MKNSYLILALILLFSSCATKSSFSTFYNENIKASEVSLSSPAVFAKMFINKGNLNELKPLFRHVKHFKILVFENNDKSIDKKFNKFVKKQDFETLFKIVDHNTNVQFYLSNNKSQKKEIILRVKDGESYVLIGLRTNMSDAELENVLKKINFNSDEIQLSIN